MFCKVCLLSANYCVHCRTDYCCMIRCWVWNMYLCFYTLNDTVPGEFIFCWNTMLVFLRLVKKKKKFFFYSSRLLNVDNNFVVGNTCWFWFVFYWKHLLIFFFIFVKYLLTFRCCLKYLLTCMHSKYVLLLCCFFKTLSFVFPPPCILSFLFFLSFFC